ncbi:MAG TPA: STAS/SEC14 domain-containing protein [Anaerolineales bacterium]|nr:STAS/SEC14 domain-containing protein [Anaerolineales bacterium]
MTFMIQMEQDGILRIHLEGDITQGIVKSFKREYTPYVDASTAEIPLKNLLYLENLGSISQAARHFLTELNQDPRYGMAAFVSPPRKARVLGQFIQKATGRDNIQFFNNETEALSWLKNHKKATISST